MTGITPVKFEVPRKDPITVEVIKEGYHSEQVVATPKVSGGGAAAGAGNILIGGFIGNPVHVKLTPSDQPRPGAGEPAAE